MARITTAEMEKKRELAEVLYIQMRLPQCEIATKVNVTEATVGRWKEKYSWDTLRASHSMSKDQELRRLMAQLNELNDHIAAKPEGTRWADSKQADVLSKISRAIKDLETELGIADTVNVFQAFLKYCRSRDLELALRINYFCDEYLKTLLK